MQKCPNCQAENESQAPTCFLCGTTLKKRGLIGRLFGGSKKGGGRGAPAPEDYTETENYTRDVLLEEPDQFEAARDDRERTASPGPEDAPEDPVVLKERGKEYLNQGQYQLAVEANNEAIRLNPQYTDAYYNRGLAYIRLGQYHRAIQDFDEAIGLNSLDPDAYYNRAYALFMLHQLPRAIADYARSIELAPNGPERYIGRGAAYFEQGAYERSIEDFDQAIRLGEYPSAYANRAVSQIRLGRFVEAEEDIKRAEELGYDPQEAIAELDKHR